MVPKIVDPAAPVSSALLERLQGHVQTDLVAVLETVHHRPGWSGHLDRNPLDPMFLDPLRHAAAGEAHDAQRGIVDARPGGGPFQRHPDFMGILGADLVEAKSREQTDDTVGNKFGRLGHAVVSGDVGVGRHIKTAAGPHHQTLLAEPAQVFRVDAARG